MAIINERYLRVSIVRKLFSGDPSIQIYTQPNEDRENSLSLNSPVRQPYPRDPGTLAIHPYHNGNGLGCGQNYYISTDNYFGDGRYPQGDHLVGFHFRSTKYGNGWGHGKMVDSNGDNHPFQRMLIW